jgi:hypothetical protein
MLIKILDCWEYFPDVWKKIQSLCSITDGIPVNLAKKAKTSTKVELW